MAAIDTSTPSSGCAPDDWMCRAMEAVNFGLDVKDRLEWTKLNQGQLDELRAKAELLKAQAQLNQSTQSQGSDLTPWLFAAGAVVVLVVLFLVVKKD